MSSPEHSIPDGAFPIRAHHLATFHEILLSENPTSAISSRMADFGNSLVWRHPGDGYVADVAGENLEGLAALLSAEQTFHKTLLELPDDSPILIGSQPDAICAGCFKGDHCSKEVSPQLDRDILYWQAFMHQANRMGFRARYSIVPGHADASQNIPLGIYTSASVLRSVVGHADFANSPDKIMAASYANSLGPVGRYAKPILETFLPPIQRLRPVIGAFAVGTAAASVFSIGSVVGAVQSIDKVTETRPHRAIADAVEAQAMNDLERGLTFGAYSTGATILLSVIPKRRKKD